MPGNVVKIRLTTDVSVVKYGFQVTSITAKTYEESTSGLIYLRARWYAPDIGRFISEDPIKDGSNWYVYTANNPINRWDPTGLLVSDWDIANLSPGDLKTIRKNDATWHREGATQAEKDAAAASSKTIREGYIASGQYVDDRGYVQGTSISAGRQAAVDYALKYANSSEPHDGYWYFDGKTTKSNDCANFVSQALAAGGISQSEYWYWNGYNRKGIKGKIGDPNVEASESWTLVPNLYRYMDENHNARGAGNVVYIGGVSDIVSMAGSVQPGDLIAFAGDGINIGHVGLVTEARRGDIFYSAHTEPRQNISLTYMYNSGQYAAAGTVYIIHIAY